MLRFSPTAEYPATTVQQGTPTQYFNKSIDGIHPVNTATQYSINLTAIISLYNNHGHQRLPLSEQLISEFKSL